jgi:hypothetical protein
MSVNMDSLATCGMSELPSVRGSPGMGDCVGAACGAVERCTLNTVQLQVLLVLPE